MSTKFLRILALLLVPFLLGGGSIRAQISADSLAKIHAQTKYVQYRGKTRQELKSIPKRDRPDLAVEQDFLRTLDPALGYPPQERLENARAYADLLRAQEAVPGDASNAWVERGPSNVGGRTRALAWDPTSVAAGGNKVWAGGVTGGLWYNTDITNVNTVWQSAGNQWDNIAVTAIAFDPTNPLVAYVGTGEGWFAGSSRGAGVWKTTNGGTTWTQLASTTGFLYINDIVVRNEGGVGVPYIAVDANYYMGQWSPGYANYGLYRSTNGGTSWTKLTLNTNSQAVSDIELDADNTLWAGTRRSPYGNTTGAQIAKSTNGTTWTTVYTVSPSISGGRTELAVGGSGSGLRVYALFESSSAAFNFIKTADGGTTWTSVTLPVDADQGIGADFTRGQAWYDLIVQVDPNNADVVLAGGIDLFRSTNSGSSWTQISKWSNNNNLALLNCPYVHADQHAIAFKPGSSSTVLFGNDGGVFYSDAISTAGTNSNAIAARNTGYNVTQFYACAMNPGAGSNNFLAGAQDNGTQRFTSAGVNATTDVIGGDGAYCFIDQTNANYQIGSYVYNNYYRSTNGGTSFSQIMNSNTGDFINPATYDSPNNILYSNYAAGQIFRKGNMESATTGTTTTVSVTNMGSGTASHLKVSPHSPAGTTTLYIGTSVGAVLRIPNAHTGTTVTASNLTGAGMPSGSISCIEVGATENTLLVTYFNYGLTSVWMTTDGGTTWVSKEGNLPDMPVRWALIHPTNPNEAILATELGVWATSNLLASSPTWVPSNSGLANVRVDMLQYRSSDKMVAAATYGRGLFTSNAFAQTANVQAFFAVDNPTPCQGATVSLTDQSLGNPNAWAWTVTPSTVTYVNSTSSTSQNPQIQFNAPGSYTIRLIASNALSSDTSIQAGAVVVGQLGLPYSEDFESSVNRARWSTINLDNSTTWNAVTGVANTSGSTSVFIDNFNYTTVGQRDGLMSPPISLAGAAGATLSFRHAYRPYDNSSTYSDSMAVYVSTNCGNTRVRVASFKETNFTGSGTYTWNTGPALSNTLFAPATNSEWCGTTAGGNVYASCKSVNLSAFAGQEIRLIFENINSYGQGFYLDDISIVATSGTAPTAAFTPTATAVCAGNSVTLTNQSTGSPTSYSWSITPGTYSYVSSTSSTSTSPVVQFTASGTYTVQLTATNSNGSTSTSKTISVTGLPAAPSGTTSQTVCYSGTVANLSATGSAIKWYLASSGGSVLSTSTALVSGTTYYASQTVNGCESAARLAVTATITAPSAPTGSASQTFCNNGTLADLVVTGTAIKWYASSTGGASLNSSMQMYPGTTYYASQTVNGCESTSRLAVTAIINTPAVPTGSASQVFCNSATVGDLVATGSSIKWYATAGPGPVLGSSTPLVNGTSYFATQTINGCESDGWLSVTVTINAPAAPTGTAAQTFCNSGTVGSLSATGTNVQWYATSTGGSALSTSTALVSGTTYYATQTVSGCESASRLAVTATINAPAAPTGTASQTFCNSGTVTNLAATGTTIKWYATNTGGSALSTSTALVNGTTYYATQTVSSCESASRLAVTATINAPAAPTGTASQTFCNSGTVSNLAATGTNVQWYATSTGGSALNTSTALVSGTTYYATQTVSGCESASRLAVTATINAPAAPTGTAAQTFCNSGTVGSLSATGTNVQWYTTSTGGSALSTSTALVNGSTYYATQTVSGCESASRLAVTATINAPAAPSAVSPQNFCPSGSPQISDLQATGIGVLWYSASTGGLPLAPSASLVIGQTYYATQTINGCESASRTAVVTVSGNPSAPTGNTDQTFCNSGTVANLSATGTSIKWYLTATGGSPLMSSIPLVSGSTYYASQTVGGCESSARLSVSVTVLTPAAPTGSVAQTFCNTATVAQLSVNGANIQWYATTAGGTPLSPGTALTNGTSYYASQTLNGCESASRLAVTTTINAPATPAGNASQTFCNSATVADLVASGTLIKWYAASTGGSPLASSTPLVTGTSYYASQTLNACESATRLAVGVTVSATPAPSAASIQTFCNAATVAQLSATGSGVQWYLTASGGAPLSGTASLANGSTYYASQTLNGCESTSRTATLVSLTVPAAPTGTALQTLCNSGTVAQLSATGTGIQWYATSTGGTALSVSTALVSGTTYYASQTVNGCESAVRLAVTASINAPSAPSGSTLQTFCNSGTVAQLSATGAGIQWYATSTGGAPLSTSTALINGTSYFASQTVNSCESSLRLAVTAIINAPSAPTGASVQTFCNSGTVAQLSATGTGIQWYATSTGGTALNATAPLANGTTYYASQTLNGCESPSRLSVTAIINAPSAPTGASTQTFCNSGTVAQLSATGTGIQWYATSTGGTALNATAPLANGTTYYASQTINSCESAARLAVTALINTPAAPTGPAVQALCASGTVGQLAANGSSIQWYATAVGGNALGTGTALVSNTTYYASQTVNGCESAARLAVLALLVPQPSGNSVILGPTDYCLGDPISTVFQWSNATPATVSIQWRRNGQPVSGQTGVTFTATQAGYYDAELSSLPGCSSVMSGDSIKEVVPPVLNPISGPNYAVASDTGVYSISGSTGAPFVWTANGGVILSGQGTSSVQVIWLTSGWIEVRAQSGPCIRTDSMNVAVSGIGLDESERMEGAAVRPNPANGWASITPWNDGDRALIFSSNGQCIAEFQPDGTIDASGLPSGLYSVWIQRADGVLRARIRWAVQR